VAILAAAYFFIVKPALDTTEDISNNVNDSISQSFNGFDDLQPGIQQSVRQAEKLQEQAQQASADQIKRANKLLDCISDASGDVNAIQRCNTKFSP
jgi:F0F1-type ATP synthase membrane subunit b/b'